MKLKLLEWAHKALNIVSLEFNDALVYMKQLSGLTVPNLSKDYMNRSHFTELETGKKLQQKTWYTIFCIIAQTHTVSHAVCLLHFWLCKKNKRKTSVIDASHMKGMWNEMVDNCKLNESSWKRSQEKRKRRHVDDRRTKKKRKEEAKERLLPAVLEIIQSTTFDDGKTEAGKMAAKAIKNLKKVNVGLDRYENGMLLRRDLTTDHIRLLLTPGGTNLIILEICRKLNLPVPTSVNMYSYDHTKKNQESRVALQICLGTVRDTCPSPPHTE